jgi:hypothetical protein
MAWQVTLNSGLKEVVLPDGLRYQGGATVVLSDADYGQLSAHAVSSLFSGAAQLTGGLAKVAATPVGGFALANGTSTILTWTAPADGQIHRASVYGSEDVISAMTGGNVNVTWTDPSGGSQAWTIFPSASSAGWNYAISQPPDLLVAPGSAVAVVQATALTAGAATLWAEIRAS